MYVQVYEADVCTVTGQKLTGALKLIRSTKAAPSLHTELAVRLALPDAPHMPDVLSWAGTCDGTLVQAVLFDRYACTLQHCIMRQLAHAADHNLPEPSAAAPLFPPAQYHAVIRALLETLAYAHARGVYHCDIKPSNILCGVDGHVAVSDWGLATIVSECPEGHTITGPYGTRSYNPRELRNGRRVPPNSTLDTFPLALVVVQLILGLPPQTTRGLYADGELYSALPSQHAWLILAALSPKRCDRPTVEEWLQAWPCGAAGPALAGAACIAAPPAPAPGPSTLISLDLTMSAPPESSHGAPDGNGRRVAPTARDASRALHARAAAAVRDSCGTNLHPSGGGGAGRHTRCPPPPRVIRSMISRPGPPVRRISSPAPVYITFASEPARPQASTSLSGGSATGCSAWSGGGGRLGAVWPKCGPECRDSVPELDWSGTDDLSDSDASRSSSDFRSPDLMGGMPGGRSGQSCGTSASSISDPIPESVSSGEQSSSRSASSMTDPIPESVSSSARSSDRSASLMLDHVAELLSPSERSIVQWACLTADPVPEPVSMFPKHDVASGDGAGVCRLEDGQAEGLESAWSKRAAAAGLEGVGTGCGREGPWRRRRWRRGVVIALLPLLWCVGRSARRRGQ